MRRRTIRKILSEERGITVSEGFGLASVAREGAIDLADLAIQLRRLRLPRRRPINPTR
jgi:hypothetical protein